MWSYPLDRASARNSAPGRAEAAAAARRLAELGGLLERRRLEAHDQELGDAVAGRDVERDVAVGVEEQHADLAAVARVDQAGRVDERHAVLRRESRARQHEAGAAVGDGDRDPGPDARA